MVIENVLRSEFFDRYSWQIEAGVCAAVLLVTVVLTGGAWIEIIGSAAVFFTFMHAQVADAMAQNESRKTTPDVHCHAWLGRYFMTKEVLWLLYFCLSQAWAALAGVFVFLIYPLWRRYYKKVAGF